MHCTDDVYGRTQSDVASILSVHVTHFPHKFFDALSLETLAAGKRVSRCQRTESLYLLTHLVDYMKYIRKARAPLVSDRVQPRGQFYDESWPRRASVHVLEARERSHRGSTHYMYPTHSLPDLSVRGAGVRVLKRVYTSCGARSCKHAPCGGVFHEHVD